METKKNYSNLYMGVFLILLGFTFLADNFHWIDVSMRQVFRLWPLILIFWGIRYLNMREPVRAFANFGLIILFFLLLFTGKDRRFDLHFGFSDKDQEVNFSDDEDMDGEGEDASKYDVVYSVAMNPEIQSASLKMNVPASDFHLEKTTEDLFKLVGEDIFFGLKKDVDIQGNHADISFKPAQENIKFNSGYSPDIDLKLNPSPVWDLDISSGASSVEMDLRPFKVKKVVIESGASSLDLTLGDKMPETKVEIKAGASSVHINVPEETGVEVRFSDVMSMRKLDEFRRQKKNKNVYVTGNFDKAGKKIFINIESALGSFEIERY